jgi:hypothetical protein
MESTTEQVIVPTQQSTSVPTVTPVHPTPCASWCQHRQLPRGHNHTANDTVHRSVSLALRAPGSGDGEALVRAELFQLDERADIGTALMYLEGETSVELSGPEVAIFIAYGRAFFDGLEVLHREMGGGQ